jgi:hypothetical protein
MAMPSLTSAKSNKCDHQIPRDVLDEFAWDARVKATEVDVQVDHGGATLS